MPIRHAQRGEEGVQRVISCTLSSCRLITASQCKYTKKDGESRGDEGGGRRGFGVIGWHNRVGEIIHGATQHSTIQHSTAHQPRSSAYGLLTQWNQNKQELTATNQSGCARMIKAQKSLQALETHLFIFIIRGIVTLQNSLVTAGSSGGRAGQIRYCAVPWNQRSRICLNVSQEMR